jgi:formylmethanofuran dehydrogenase subunit E
MQSVVALSGRMVERCDAPRGGLMTRKENPRQEIEDAVARNDLHHLLLLNGMLHGHFCPGSAMGVKAGARAVRDLGVASKGMEDVVAIVETNSCFSDGVQMVTGCTFGNNALIYRDYGKTVLTLARRNGEAVRVAARADRQPLDRYPEAAGLFQKVVKERRGTSEEDARLRQLWIDLSFDMLSVPDEEMFSITPTTIEPPAYARMFGSTTCSICGESTMEPRTRMKDGRPVCIPCSRQEYYQLGGDGMAIVSERRC